MALGARERSGISPTHPSRSGSRAWRRRLQSADRCRQGHAEYWCRRHDRLSRWCDRGRDVAGQHEAYCEAIPDSGYLMPGTVFQIGDIGHLHRAIVRSRAAVGTPGARPGSWMCVILSTSWAQDSICEPPSAPPRSWIVKPLPLFSATPSSTIVCLTLARDNGPMRCRPGVFGSLQSNVRE